MKNFVQKKLKDQKGMTLIELLAVIVIIAIIAAIAIPAIGNIIENSRYSAVKSDATNVLNAAQLYYTENPQGPADAKPLTVALLKSDGFLESEGKIPADATLVRGTTSKSLELTTTAIDFSGGKKVQFTSATIKAINADKTKGNSVVAATPQVIQ
ncbi:prepilin-type N-terminal cleavage/methylation domain-containing protein [Planococcus wigleyi]|uniref:Prepilin-type N-terminal cleavage/methylation domain-containing protein n=1 Tax=Planococcus wigleyi TaxID=2762216 RepID=A0ABR8WFK7_9BACL|nr:prepilin-type N-terminal cleavage/methylation domain-containing protein [Planococcus wigleyi]MBD8015820.1 prepilin-type N-terminal cleavage/methylation domain-containing protein [Planococcus wigleyi]